MGGGHCLVTPEEMAVLAGQGRYWWMRPDGSFYATDERTASDDADHYVLNASPKWLAQWGGDWQKAADVLAPLLARFDEIRNQ